MGKKAALRYLVRWAEYGPQFDTWATATDLKNSPLLLKEYRTEPLKKKNIRQQPYVFLFFFFLFFPLISFIRSFILIGWTDTCRTHFASIRSMPSIKPRSYSKRTSHPIPALAQSSCPCCLSSGLSTNTSRRTANLAADCPQIPVGRWPILQRTVLLNTAFMEWCLPSKSYN